MILTVTPNPCVDKTVFIDELRVGTFMRAAECTCIPGGKGTNVSRAVKALGRATRAMVLVGGHPGAHVVDMIREQDGVECLPVWLASQTRTITTVLERAIHRQTAFFEPGSRVTEAEARQVVETFEAAIGQAQIVTLNGTVPDPSVRWLYRDLVRIARERGVPTILDSHGPEFAMGLESMPFMVKPNLAETEELLKKCLDTEAAKWEAVSAYHARGVELVAISLGKDGAVISRRSASGACERLRVRPPAIREVNPVGSGDAFVAAFAIGLLESQEIETMAAKACAAGAANAMSWDIGHFTAEEVERIERGVIIERM